jgi:flagellar biosynthesis chaperone FliJ
MRWALQPLLDLRRWDEHEATGALGRSLTRCQAAEAEAFALRRAAEEEAARALLAGVGLAAGRWAARLRLDAERLHGLAVEAEAKARDEAAAVEARRGALRQAALRREVVEQLEAAWRRARAATRARQAEAALDDRPGRQRRSFSSSGSETRP